MRSSTRKIIFDAQRTPLVRHNDPNLLLSVLVCTVPVRVERFLPQIIRELYSQAIGKPVEILYLGDNGVMSIGEKRNHLLNLAAGRYVCFVDDDDEVAKDYIQSLIVETEKNADVISFNAQRREGDKINLMEFGISNGKNFRNKDIMYFIPNHTCAIRREIAQRHKFEHINLSEDHKWADEVIWDLKTEAKINKILYYYNFSKETSLTHGR